MNIKTCKGIVVEEDGAKQVFNQEDIIEVVGIDNNKERTVKGRLGDVIQNGFSLMIRVDTSEQYRESHIDISEELIKSIKKVPD